ncbi:DUF7701 domain-containing protein [Streptomyces sp. NPDC002346]
MNYIQQDAELIRSLVAPDVDVPDGAETLFLLYAVLLRSKGAEVTSADVHDAWAAWETMREPTHPSILPYRDLDETVQREDMPFVTAIRLAAAQK